MQEYMLLIRNNKNHQADWTSEFHLQFLKSCESYISKLKADNRLISAQPLVREGVVISGTSGNLTEQPLNESEAIQVGYYLIYANDINDAISIASNNPEFTYSNTASIEVRPVKTIENTTGFVYPKQ